MAGTAAIEIAAWYWKRVETRSMICSAVKMASLPRLDRLPVARAHQWELALAFGRWPGVPRRSRRIAPARGWWPAGRDALSDLVHRPQRLTVGARRGTGRHTHAARRIDRAGW